MNAAAFPASMFKAYDIRGRIPDGLNAQFAKALGRALGALALESGVRTLVLGRDGRLSGPELLDALADGIQERGVDVIDLGLVPTPLVYFACAVLQTGSGVAVTGSHNPPEYNGFKMMMAGDTLSGDAITALRGRMLADDGQLAASRGRRESRDIAGEYQSRIVGDVRLSRPLRIVVDAGNGVAGGVAPALYRAMGCEVTELFCEVDGNFPNHHPDPADPHNLEDLQQALKATGADLGLAFDGDGDRLGVVTPNGQIIWPDRQMILFARDVLQRQPGATILFDVKCSRLLGEAIEQAGGKPLMWQTGHSLIKKKLRETGAPLAGEMSGHVFFKERWFGFDDGLYTGARLLEILSREAHPGQALEALPDAQSTPELKISVPEGQAHAMVARLQERASEFFGDAQRCITIDGLRVEYADGFGLVRASNTTPVLVLRFEGQDQAAIARIQAGFRAALKSLDLTEMPF